MNENTSPSQTPITHADVIANLERTIKGKRYYLSLLGNPDGLVGQVIQMSIDELERILTDLKAIKT